MQAGKNRQQSGQPKRARMQEGELGMIRIEQVDQNGDDLNRCRALADNGRLNFVFFFRQRKNGDAQNDNHISGDDDDCHPGRNDFQNSQRHIRTDQQELIGNRVQKRPQGSTLVQTTGDKAIQAVGHAGYGKDQQRLRELIADEENDKQGCQQNPDQGQNIWNTDG